ncbi:protein of unknown function [Taphrina deformans PYCC 5710]|uniref:ABC1 atypical kinase-like domain-containing protein n=1 Tax=Taphrina deformans (strain PYCC 5710 / ATCC 11124 / CBS 356.35 / IMI 108563 / JCM 9778 / NBRC 8474) TaxID=1097556 RepID=R4XDY8_TAPDE|nr:protein of unknown function [Taphrina deformans PYCC 5710]|eukprot:CCG84040.1 protein of unknown function [Taphrina deformans PYCC 5710]
MRSLGTSIFKRCRSYASPDSFTNRIVPDPSTLRPPLPKTTRRIRVPVKTLAVIGTGLIGGTVYDRLNGRCISRTLRTAVAGVILAVDYKLNFNPENADGIMALHERAAQRIYDVIVANGGLYIKIGQTLAMQSAVLPEPYSRIFSTLFDEAPQVPWSEVKALFEKELGKNPDDVFEHIDHHAAAAASIAQVHRARLKTGEEVAVKVQKPEIQMQVDWDLWAYRLLVWVYEKYVFDIPMYFTVNYTCSHLADETNFMLEAGNSKRMSEFIVNEPELRNSVYVPKVFDEYSSRRIMTAEWITGVKATDHEKFEKMGFSSKAVMELMVATFSAQMFKFGYLHCDPHPGNLLIRPNPKTGKLQMVVIDHGLYISESEEFRQQYCLFWKSLFLNDMATIRRISGEWGVGAPDLLASATLMRPYRHDPNAHRTLSAARPTPQTEKERKEEAYAAQLAIKEKVKSFLLDQEKIPQELLFIGRNMRIVQSNNHNLGSPVNRISIAAKWASASLASASPNATFPQRIKHSLSHLRFLITVGILDFGFWAFEVRRWVLSGFGLRKGHQDGWEDEIQKNLKVMAKENFGIEINEAAFDG